MRLDTLRVLAPCHEDWETMRGDDRSRHCAVCDQRVTNLSELARSEAEETLSHLATQPSACVRYLQAPTGEIATRSTLQEQFLALLQEMAARPPETTP
jgi:hypothetical protein